MSDHSYNNNQYISVQIQKSREGQSQPAVSEWCGYKCAKLLMLTYLSLKAEKELLSNRIMIIIHDWRVRERNGTLSDDDAHPDVKAITGTT